MSTKAGEVQRIYEQHLRLILIKKLPFDFRYEVSIEFRFTATKA